MQFANPRPLPPQIIYLATLPPPSPGKRPKALKHANTFPPDKKSSPRRLLPARLAMESPIKYSSSQKPSSATLDIEQPTHSTPQQQRVSRKRSAPSELPSSDHEDIPERAVKKAKQTIAALPMSPPDTPDKKIEPRKISLNGKATAQVGPPISLPMSPPSSPPDKSKTEEHKTSLFGASKRTATTALPET